jgi:surfeit locus 1 family protein
MAGVALTVSLGLWQLRRADAKQRWHDTIVERQQWAPVRNGAVPCDAAAWQQAEQRPAVLAGRWLGERTVLLDNRPMDGRAGFVVITPLKLDPAPQGCAAQVVLVQRGWLPRDPQDRTRAPQWPDDAGRVEVPVRLVAAPSALLELGSPDAEPARIRQNVTVAGLSREWGLALLPGSVQQLQHELPHSAQAPALLRHWWRPEADVGKHLAYAAQWFAMAALMAGLYLWFQWWRPSRPAVA